MKQLIYNIAVANVRVTHAKTRARKKKIKKQLRARNSLTDSFSWFLESKSTILKVLDCDPLEFLLKQLDYSPLFSMSCSCTSLTFRSTNSTAIACNVRFLSDKCAYVLANRKLYFLCYSARRPLAANVQWPHRPKHKRGQFVRRGRMQKSFWHVWTGYTGWQKPELWWTRDNNHELQRLWCT